MLGGIAVLLNPNLSPDEIVLHSISETSTISAAGTASRLTMMP